MFTVKAQCDYTIQGSDSWGDGWNGASLDIDVAGDVTNFTVAGFSNSVAIPSYTGDPVTITFNSGGYDSEISITIVGPDGTSLYSGPAPTDGAVIVTDTSVSTCAPPSCLAPTALAASGETTTTVDLAWTAGDSETLWDIELVDVTASGSATGTPTTEDITTNPYTLSGLSPANDYQVYLRADCGGGDTSPWTGPVSFSTPCATLSLPFSEGMDNTGSTPNCWSQSGAENWLFNTSGPNNVGNGGTISGSTDSGSYYAVVDASYTEANAILTLPSIDLSSLNTPMLTFYEISIQLSD